MRGSKPPEHENDSRPLWLNSAAVVFLVVSIALGVALVCHFSLRSEPAARPYATITEGDVSEPPRVLRLAERPARFILTDPDVADADEFRDLAARDPKAAAAVVARLGDTPDRDERLFDLMQIWVLNDPTQAADWVIGLAVGDLKTDATAELGLAWGKADPKAASRWVDENIFTENAPAGAASLTSAWAGVDIEAATEWVTSLDADTPARSEAIRALALKLGELDPQRGIAWVDRLKPDDRNLVIVGFAASWSDHDPSAAANWLRYQARGLDPNYRDQATVAVIHSWTSTGEEAPVVSDWIDGLEDGKLKEDAKAAFAETHADTSPAEAFPWASNIKDPERRLEVSMVVLEEWLLQDMEGFKVEMRNRWETFDSPLRHEVYDLLLDHDPSFKDELFRMLDERGAEEDP